MVNRKYSDQLKSLGLEAQILPSFGSQAAFTPAPYLLLYLLSNHCRCDHLLSIRICFLVGSLRTHAVPYYVTFL